MAERNDAESESGIQRDEQTDRRQQWNSETIVEETGIKSRQASAVVYAFGSFEELVETFRNAESLTDHSGIGNLTATKLRDWIAEECPDAPAVHRENDEGICTEFGTDGETSTDGNPVWWFVCPRCGDEQKCEGDPRGFANRTYKCHNCAWVSLLAREELTEFAEEHYPKEVPTDV